MALYLGTSGWSYKDWGKRFYPLGLPAKAQLIYLARHFDSVEINASFYKLPLAKTFLNWHDVTPDNFRFAVKASRMITHLKRLSDVEDSWELFLERAGNLRDKLGVILLQFPPSFKRTPETLERLETFFSYALTPGRRLALELRHATWFEPEALEFFSRHQACIVQAESSRYPHTPPEFAPADFTYYRFHGPGRLYASQYSNEDLLYWAKLIRADQKAGKDVYAYFDNDVNGYALEDARRLRDYLV